MYQFKTKYKLKRRRSIEIVPLIAITLFFVSSFSGCATLSGKEDASESAAQCRLFSRQSAVALEQGNFDEATTLLQKAVAANPTDLESRRQLAETLRERGALPTAVKHIETACQIAAEDPNLAVRAGEFRLELGDLQQAARWTERALTIDSKLPEAWALRGRIWGAAGKTDRALTDLYHALQYSPRSPEILWSIAKIHEQRGKPQRCLTTIHNLIDTYPPGQEPQSLLVMQGQALAALERHQDAVSSFAVACERGQADAEILYAMAHSQQKCGHINQAIASAKRALESNAGHQPTLQLLASLKGSTVPSDTIRR